MPEEKTEVNSTCRDAVNRLHEVMKLLDIAKLELDYKETKFTTAYTIFLVFVGLAAADFLAASTVVYSIGPTVGMNAENVFWDPVGGVFMDLTWFGLGLVIAIAFALLTLCYSMVCSLSRRATRKKVIEMNKKLEDAKSAILEVCPMELWYSGEA